MSPNYQALIHTRFLKDHACSNRRMDVKQRRLTTGLDMNLNENGNWNFNHFRLHDVFIVFVESQEDFKRCLRVYNFEKGLVAEILLTFYGAFPGPTCDLCTRISRDGSRLWYMVKLSNREPIFYADLGKKRKYCGSTLVKNFPPSTTLSGRNWMSWPCHYEGRRIPHPDTAWVQGKVDTKTDFGGYYPFCTEISQQWTPQQRKKDKITFNLMFPAAGRGSDHCAWFVREGVIMANPWDVWYWRFPDLKAA